MAATQGFLMYYSEYNCYSDAVGTKVIVCLRQGGRSSEVVVKRGSTVLLSTGVLVIETTSFTFII